MCKTGCKYPRINTPQECPLPTSNVTLRLVSTSFPQVSMWNEASVAHSTDGLINASLADFLFILVSLAHSFTTDSQTNDLSLNPSQTFLNGETQTKAEADGYGE